MIKIFFKNAVFITCIVAISLGMISLKIEPVEDPINIGFIEDCQYADLPTRKLRNYRLSKGKFEKCVPVIDAEGIDHVFILGDFIDEDLSSCDSMLPIMNELKHSKSYVLGNHDYSVADSLKDKMPKNFRLTKTHYKNVIDNWKFIIFDGSDISLYKHPHGSKKLKQSESIYNSKYKELLNYNGAIGKSQLKWLKKELDQEEKKAQNMLLLFHFPLLVKDDHILWDTNAVLSLLSKYKCVKGYVSGHNHEGDCSCTNGIHFMTLKGMVDMEENAFSIMNLTNDSIDISGFGREVNRSMAIKE